MASFGPLSMLLYDQNDVLISTEGPITGILSATITPSSLDMFPEHSLVVDVSERRNLTALQPLTRVRVYDADIPGIVCRGVILDPEQDVDDNGNRITIKLANITEELRFTTTGIGWVASTDMATIVQRLAAKRPGWTAAYLDATYPYTIRLEDPNLLGAYNLIAKQNFFHLRQGQEPLTIKARGIQAGDPARAVELGSFGAPATMRMVDPYAGSLAQATLDDSVRVVTKMKAVPTTSKIGNIATPLGAGTGDSQVVLRRLWRILFDPTYDHYGQATYFPEYDPTVARMMATPDPAQGGKLVPATLDAFGNTVIAASLDGRYYYDIINDVSRAQYGEMRVGVNQANISYPDATIANQILTERALYVAGWAQLKWFSQPYRVYSFESEGRGRVPRAGDLVSVDYNDLGNDDQGAFQSLRVKGDFHVLSVTSVYDGSKRRDSWQVSTNAQYGVGIQQQLAGEDGARQMEMLRIVPTTSASVAIFGPVMRDMDAQHPVTVPIDIPGATIRIQVASLRVDFQPLRSTVNINGAGPIKNTDGSANATGATGSYAQTALTPYTDINASTGTDGVFTGGVLSTIPGVADGSTGPVVTDLPGGLSGGDLGTFATYGGIASGNTNAFGQYITGLDVGQSPTSYGVLVGGSSGGQGVQTGGTTFGMTGPVANSTLSGPLTPADYASFGLVTNPAGGVAGTRPLVGGVAGGYGPQGNQANPFSGSVSFTGQSGLGVSIIGGTGTGGTINAGALVTLSGTAGSTAQTSTTSPDMSHIHRLPIVSGASQPAGNTLFVVSPNAGDGTVPGMSSGAGGYFHTNQWTDPAGNSKGTTHTHDTNTYHQNDITHGHYVSGGSAANGLDHTHSIAHQHDLYHTHTIDHTHDLSHSHNIAHSHDISHTHNITHSHNLAHTHTIAHRHDLRHKHDISHKHNIDHHHLFPHSHQMLAGIFESLAPTRIQLWIDDGSGAFTDRSPEFGGPWTASFAIPDLAKYVSSPGKTVRLQFISIAGAANTAGLGALSISGTWIFEVLSASSTVVAR